MSELHENLKGYQVDCGQGRMIDMYQRMIEIRTAASEKWLKKLEKNGFDHSGALEEYLDKLTDGLGEPNRLTKAETFVLLASVYLHDIGYWAEGEGIVSRAHQKRSSEYILADPVEYRLGDFPPFGDGTIRAARAVAEVCHGHAPESELSLDRLDNRFFDRALDPDQPLNLRKLAALLRLADEADDPYTRPESEKSWRGTVSLVRIGPGTICWCWDQAGPDRFYQFESVIKQKRVTLKTALDYLADRGAGEWKLVLEPEAPQDIPFMAPDPSETFVGREEDLETLHENLRKRKVGAVTGVVGTGGIGKTELARVYAARYRPEYPDGVFWVSLKEGGWLRAAEAIWARLMPGSDRPAWPDENGAKTAVERLLDRPHALLVIDNVDEADQIIQPACRVLVTTRNREAFGRLHRNAIHNLSGLPEEDGLKLLAEIIGPERVQADRAGAVRMLELLGGMPLALEIAARHLDEVPHLSFPEYIGQVGQKIDRLRIESDPDYDVAASLALSLDQLEEDKKDGKQVAALFLATGVCSSAGFEARPLAHAAGLDPAEADPLVGRLHRRSLLEFDPASKRYNTHPLLRQTAESSLEAYPERRDAFRLNHCQYFLDLVRAIDHDPGQIISEKDGYRQAMIQTIQLGRAEELMPRFLERLERPFKRSIEAGEYEEAFQYLKDSDLIYIDQLGLSRELVAWLEPLHRSCRELEEENLAWVCNNLGMANHRLGEYRKAIELYKEAHKIVHHLGDERFEGAVLNNLGLAWAALDKYCEAIEYYEQALKIARRIGDVRGEGNALGNMGASYMELEEYHKAIDLYKQALEIARRIGDIRGEAADLGNMGAAYLALDESEKAIELCGQALDIHRRIGDMGGEGNVLANMGAAYARLGQRDRAVESFKASRGIFQQLGLAHKVHQIETMMEKAGV